MPEETAPPMPSAELIANVGPRSRQSSTAPRAAAFAEKICNSIRAIDESVESKPQILAGTPVLKGTRFSIAQLFAELAEGESIDTIAADFELNRESLSAILHSLAVCLEQPAPR